MDSPLLTRLRQPFDGGRPASRLRRRARDALAGVVGHGVATFRPGTPVWEREWDVLCILDGCRLDLMREHVADDRHRYLPGPDGVEAEWSVGSQSAEWMDRTFAATFREEMARTAYVTGNPFSAQRGDQVDTVSGTALPLDDQDFGFLHETWRVGWEDDAISTIPPRPLTDAAIGVWRNRADLGVERLIVHYMQPHAPFRSRPEWFLGDANPDAWGRIDDDADDEGDAVVDELAALDSLDEKEREALAAFAEADGEVRDPWTRVRDGELPLDEFWAAYRDNLAWVLDDVGRLLENCDAHVALTSDHGNAAGEWGVWSHPPGTPLPVLRRVPWVDLTGHDTGTHRPGIPERTGDPGAAGEAGADPAVEERLADLGYR